MRIGFYAPLKAIDHPVPSGDRAMARALVKALGEAGHTVTVLSGLRSFLAVPDRERQEAIQQDAERERDRLLGTWRTDAPPDLWFTYHNHYKAPDLLGPALAARAGLPYVIAEASHAPKRAQDWGRWHAAAETASAAADLHLCLTARDRAGLTPLLKPATLVVDLPPFIDLQHPTARNHARPGGPFRMAVIAMMRPGDKLASYRLLAASLERLVDRAWHLDIVGDGPARPVVEACFGSVPPDRLTWHGQLETSGMGSVLAQADLFVWPGFGEAFGLAYLEAQAAGLPVLALRIAGVPEVLRPGITGVLVEDASASAFADALRALMADPAALRRMGDAARRFVQEERLLDSAARRLGHALRLCRDRKGKGHG